MFEEKHKNKFCEMPDEIELNCLADFFKALSDPTRVRILFSLFQKEICVGELVAKMQLTDSAVSHQLHVLKISGLVKKKRKGRMMFYAVADERVRSIIMQGLKHIEK